MRKGSALAGKRRVLACLFGLGLLGGARLVVPAEDEPIYLTAEVKPPERTVFVMPVYPDELRRAEIEGNVTLEIVVGRNGDVENEKVIRSNPPFDDAAEKAVRQWKYRPALKEGMPVRVYLTVIVAFTLKGRPAPDLPIYLTSGIDPPKRTVFVKPDYPDHAKHDGKEGKVLLEIVVNKEGDVETDMRVLKSNPLFDDAAILAVRQWKYEPALKDGQAVRVYLTVLVEFNLKQVAAATSYSAHTSRRAPRRSVSAKTRSAQMLGGTA